MPVSFVVRSVIASLVGLGLLAIAPPAHAGVFDFLFGKSATEPAKTDPRRKVWQVRDFTAVRIVPGEPGAAANDHPQQLTPEQLRPLLAQVRIAGGGAGAGEPLFAADELADLLEPLIQAFFVAGRDEDILLLSSSRRGGTILAQPLAVTARLFVQGGALQLVVADARFEFYNQYVGSRVPPEFTFGSRGRPGTAVLQAAAGTSRRPDWLALPLTPTVAAAGAAAPRAVPPTTAAPAAAVAPAATGAAVAPVTPAAAAVVPPRSRDAAFAEEIEQRLVTLKRLRDRGLISEDEYQQKRREILQLL